MGRLFFGSYADPVTRFQTLFAACSSGDRLGFRLHASGLQSPVHVRLFLALDDGCGSVQHPQRRATSLSLVQSRHVRLLLALWRFHCRTVPSGSIGTKGNWPYGSGSFDDGCCDLASWISHGTCHYQTCPLSAFDLLVDAPDVVLICLNDAVNEHSCLSFPVLRNDADCPDQSKAHLFPAEFVTRIQESLC